MREMKIVEQKWRGWIHEDIEQQWNAVIAPSTLHTKKTYEQLFKYLN